MRHADCKIVRMMAIETYHDVFDRAHFAEQLGVLERSCNSQPPNRMGSAAIDPFAFERDRSAIDRVEAGDDVEHRTLARAVWPDHGLDRSPSDIQRNLIERHDSAEADGELVGLE